MKKKSLMLNAIFNIVYKLLNVIFPLVSSAYISRILLADGLGSIAYAQNIVSYFTMIAALGIPTYGIREISKVRNDRNKLNTTFTELFIINFLSTSISLVFYYIIILGVSNFKSDFILHSVFGLLILFNFINVDWFYQGEEKYVYIAIRSTIIKIISLILLFIFVKTKEDYIIYALITCIATGGNYILNIINLRKLVSFTKNNLNLKKHLKPILILTICSISIELYSKIDITMLGQELNKSIIGYYSNAQKIINMVLTLVTAISSVFLPRLSYCYQSSKESFNSLLNIAFKVVLYFSFPAFFAITLLSNNIIIVLFGEYFLPAGGTLKILAILFLIKGVGDILCYQVIISSGHEGKLVFSYLLGAITNIALNAILIPIYGMNGAAIASVISELAVNTTLLYSSIKLFKLNITKNFILSLFLSNLALVISIYICSIFTLTPLFSIIIQGTIGLLIYIVFSFITKNDILVLFINKIKNFSYRK